MQILAIFVRNSSFNMGCSSMPHMYKCINFGHLYYQNVFHFVIDNTGSAPAACAVFQIHGG